MTYFLCYNLFVYLNDNIIKTINQTGEPLAVIVMVLMSFESTIYLAYYKDAIFAMITLFNYIGMYLNNYDHRNSNKETRLPQVEKCQISLIVI